MAKNKIGILFSGGLESTCLLNHYKKLNYDIYPLYIKYGYHWENTELLYANKIINYYNLDLYILDYSNILKVSQLGNVTNSNENTIPLRNLSLFTFSSMYFFNKNISQIAIGLQGSKDYPDTSLEYIKNSELLIQKGLGTNFSILLPFYGLSKEDIYKLNKDIPTKLIFSCTNPINNQMCRKCYKCLLLNNLLKGV